MKNNNNQIKSEPPDVSPKVVVEQEGNLTLEQLEKLGGSRLLTPEMKKDAVLVKAVETSLSNAIIIDTLRAENKKLFRIIGERVLAITPPERQDEIAQHLLQAGIQLGYISPGQVERALAKVMAGSPE